MPELEKLSATQLLSAVASGVTTAVVPFGSIEYQGAHLPLGADALLADAVGREVAGRLDALLVPTFRVGFAAGHAMFPGTLTVSAETVTDLACAVAQRLARDGLRVIALVSAHGGNAEPLRAAAARLAERAPECAVCVPGADVGPNPGAHSGRWLTSVMLTLRPDLVHIDSAPAELAGELAEASAERGNEYLERFVASVVAQIRATVP